MMKYAIYLKTKPQILGNEIIANPTAITTMQNDITVQLAQFESFLQKLQAKYGDLSTTGSTQSNTGDQPSQGLSE
jgi:hypothetical protein